MRNQRHFIMSFIGIAAVLVLLSGFFSGPRNAMINGVASIFSSSSSFETNEQIRSLQRENANLRAQLDGLNHQSEGEYVVYSSYPFNNKSEIVVGEVGGSVSVGNTVTFGSSIVVGKVKQVSGNQAVVTTIFDPSFETAVRIGESSTDGLIKGGNTLTVSLIPEDALIEEGDIVYTASKDYPYGLEIGTVTSIEAKEGTPFKSATIEPFFAVGNLRHVSIVN